MKDTFKEARQLRREAAQNLLKNLEQEPRVRMEKPKRQPPVKRRLGEPHKFVPVTG